MPSTPLVSKPGQFRARCNLAKKVAVAKATPEQRREAEANDYRKTYVLDHRGKPVWFWYFPACEGFETTDREAYATHLKEFHGGGLTKVTQPKIIRDGKGMWNGPRLTEDGKAWSDEKHDTVTCPCGLVLEQRDDMASVQFVSEHLQMCAERAGAA